MTPARPPYRERVRLRWIVLLAASVAVLTGTLIWAFAGSVVGPLLGVPDDGAASADDFPISAVYDVDAEGVLSPEPDAPARAVWDEFVRVVSPGTAAALISQYHVGDDADSDTLAYVYREDDPELWVLAANLAYAYDPDLLRGTLVHEYAHILSLGIDDTDPTATSCDTVRLNEGCLLPGAALTAFEERFWRAYDDAPAPDNVDSDLAWEFYQAHEEDFVSDYAATNVAEDFAESFMTYVLESDVGGDSTVARKLAFFDAFPEYADARERIRAEFGL